MYYHSQAESSPSMWVKLFFYTEISQFKRKVSAIKCWNRLKYKHLKQQDQDLGDGIRKIAQYTMLLNVNKNSLS